MAKETLESALPWPLFFSPILLCVSAPVGGGNSKKIFELGNTKSNWESFGIIWRDYTKDQLLNEEVYGIITAN